MTGLSSSIAAAALFALLCWWFGTGAILWLVRRPPAAFHRSLVVCRVLLALPVHTFGVMGEVRRRLAIGIQRKVFVIQPGIRVIEFGAILVLHILDLM